ncbi:hypothetical protein M2158_006002 [Streptomyces sp. SAI-144]|jgi:hypothetical protein|uniref:hypothetical protein n=1 Tax=unclassified Streptomyces TaxID=2593676 RepID=UPI002473B977|nr:MULTISPECIES: hypothetical protein [unclassified Streptomyces]MDH6437461.1 hypothetical protein [Streptomyces sp. SAI-144]MDH6484886.1 hypothetical protein [Streptomyces sp. SAI-127]
MLFEQPDTAPEPTAYGMTNLPATTPIADLVRLGQDAPAHRWNGTCTTCGRPLTRTTT